MNSRRLDLIYLRRNIAYLALSILTGGCIVAFAGYLHHRSISSLGDLIARIDQVQSRLSGFSTEAAQVRAGLTAYENLSALGIIGAEDRRQWLEQLDSVGHARRLLGLQYEFQAQVSAGKELGGSDSGDGYQLMVSTMKLQLDLLHENDLIGLLADLRGTVGAWLLTRECRIDRLPESIGSADGTRGRLRAECTIDWATLREAS
jgi:hypothetical protein